MDQTEEIGGHNLPYIINHVFLPPKLPQQADSDAREGDVSLLKVALWAARQYQNELMFSAEATDATDDRRWRSVIQLLTTMGDLESTNSPDGVFRRTVMHMGTGDVLAMHIGAQNAGLILRQSEDQIIFESFEASPKAVNVLATKGKLLCTYPGPAIAVDLGTAKDEAFIAELASFLDTMKRDVLPLANEKTSKAGSEVTEERETTHPMFITGMLTGILRAIGKPYDVRRIQKRIADDVLWDNASTPWRRSPLWLVTRVALQTLLLNANGSSNEYKSFMVFFIAKVLDMAITQSFPSDILFVMNAKLSRRVSKIGNELPSFVVGEAQSVGHSAFSTLNRRWAEEKRYHRRPFRWNPRVLDAQNDTNLTMSKSRSHLLRIKDSGSTEPQRKPFLPQEAPRLDMTLFRMPRLDHIKTLASLEVRGIALADFENWVQVNLTGWLATYIDYPETCNILANRIEDYLSPAKENYFSDPEGASIMILTTLELWIALDKTAVKNCHLLKDYFPMFDSATLKPLLLPQAQHITRLHEIEGYLDSRQKNSAPFGSSIFSDTLTRSSFAVRYFDQSDLYSTLRTQILQQAEVDRYKKGVEHAEMVTKYHELLETAREKACDYFTHWEEGWTRHDFKCRKCAILKRASSMKIAVHEWPLPEGELQSKAVVFELRCPMVFSVWRDLTFRVLRDIGQASGPSQKKPEHEPLEQLDTYPGLQQYFQRAHPTRTQKLQWSSSTKSFQRTHYRNIRSTASRDELFVNHALHYRLFDSEKKQWIEDPIRGSIVSACTFTLPEGPYRKLQYAILSTLHTPNQVIARQSECPGELSVHEYLSFGMLRAGSRLQWRNILRELRSRTLTFSNEAVEMLLMQCAWQAGAPGRAALCRLYHEDLHDNRFGLALVSELRNVLASVEMNWHEATTVHILIVLANQLLSFTRFPGVVQGVIDFLRGAREVTLGWARDLSRQLPKCGPHEMRESQRRVIQVAAICRATFHAENFRGILLSSDQDVAVLVECATTIHQNLSAVARKLGSFRQIRTLLDRDRRFSHAIEGYLRARILASPNGIDLTGIWSGYRKGTTWKSLPEPNQRWMSTDTAPGEHNQAQRVHYNLLSGQLLVEGLPLGRMQPHYTSHQTYVELFGERVLDVFPSGMKGMAFQTKQLESDHEIHFAMEETQLLIRTRRASDSAIHQFIPQAMLKGDFPTQIIETHFHWLEVSSGKIELRDKEDPWSPKKPHEWYISNSYGLGSQTLLHLGADEKLLDVRSSTFDMITRVLGPLEYKEWIDVRISNLGVTAQLTRLKLDFFIKDSNLVCKQFSEMSVDDNQDIGTLVGLENRLVLRRGKSRSVIVPHGKITFQKCQTHVTVDIDTKGLQRVKYHTYTVDPILGRLVGNGSLLSHLYKCYLHAVTSYCVPDPLTRRTGTEEAISELQAAATWSFQTLDTSGEEAELFKLIAGLTPGRVYYPRHKKSMQQVTWNCLPPIAQHDAFHTIVDAVSSHVSRFHIFHEDLRESSARYYQTTSAPELLERAAIRNAVYRTEQFGGSLATSAEDAVYVARDAKNRSTKESLVCYIAGMVDNPPAKLEVCADLQNLFEGWGLLTGKGSGEEVQCMVGYHSRWMNEELRDVWCSLYDTLTQDPPRYSKYQLMFLLSAFAYNTAVSPQMIGTLLAIATLPQFRDIKLPNYIEYTLYEGYMPDKDALVRAVKECTSDLEEILALEDSRAELFGDLGLSFVQIQLPRARKMELDSQSRAFVSKLMSQWPCDMPQPPEGDYPRLDLQAAMVRITPFFRNWYQNSLFETFVEGVQHILDSVNSKNTGAFSPYTFKTFGKQMPSAPKRNLIRLTALFNRPAPGLPEPPSLVGPSAGGPTSATPQTTIGMELQSLIRSFKNKRGKGFRKQYAGDLEKSLQALRAEQKSVVDDQGKDEKEGLESFRNKCVKHLSDIWDTIEESLKPTEKLGDTLLYKAGLWPRLSPTSLLQHLATAGDPKVDIPSGWKAVLVKYGNAITMLQRAERLLSAVGFPDFLKELGNKGHEDWEPLEKPDWLLMEIESNILVRPVQADIANLMISPTSNQNAIVQLLMGEGKTSVVTPIAAAALADGERLVRVVVLKPLSAQMYQILVQKLGGLLNRRIFFMPFTRSVKMGLEEAKLVRTLFEDCRRMGGIVLAQPEHVLSFKLLSLEWLSHAKNKKGAKKPSAINKRYDEVAEILVDTQRWLETTSRDILDESDEILNVRHELIYSIGRPRPIQNAPDRWTIIQDIFSLIQNHFRENTCQSKDYEVGPTKNAAQFPTIRILQTRESEPLLRKIAAKVVADGLPSINFRFLSAQKRRSAEDFITNPTMDNATGQQLLNSCGQSDSDISTATLYLLRGLFAHNIIFFILREKRWKVDYGLDLHRTLLAVPYRAKDSPAGRAEFSHPDVAITLTCLSYYYGGLNEDQLETCFQGLYKSDSPTLQYERWVKGITGLDRRLKNLSGINLDDVKQWKEIVGIFKYNKAVIDFYLAEVVFPREAKEFKDKLSTSGWDIAGEKTHPTTGFSGTNDNRYLLPLSIEQIDRDAQLSTNARVLSYLLQEENSYVSLPDNDHERFDFQKILSILNKGGGGSVRVLLDVGAQVLELSNYQVAETWLKKVPKDNVEAAVFFDDKDVLTVVTRDGLREPLLVSAFAQKLEKCVVYLDEAHTRGTDLKLPINTRAAVTLGPGLTKDRLVQACMRMRKLGQGHSVLFCAPLEIQHKLAREAQKDHRKDIQVRDVILWCMNQTCMTYRKLVPVWAKQGVSYQNRFVAWTKIIRAPVKSFPQDVLEKEAKTLQEHYGFERSRTNSIDGYYPARQHRRQQFKEIAEKCLGVDVKSFRGAPMLEEQEQEQERELYHEIECERDNLRPGRACPVEHNILPAVKRFVQEGALPEDGDAFIPAFRVFGNTSAKGCDMPNWSQKLLVSTDFARVIDGKHPETDNFLRPVNWVVSSLVDPTFLVILSPYEVNRLLPDINKYRMVVLHMYAPRVIKDLPSYEDFMLFSTPPPPPPRMLWLPPVPLVDQLNIFAGQLYFRDYRAYERVCRFLGLCLDDTGASNAEYIGSDGFVEKRHRQIMRMHGSPFTTSPVLPLRALFTLRRKGHSYLATHMGHILHGRPLGPEDFDNRTVIN